MRHTRAGRASVWSLRVFGDKMERMRQAARDPGPLRRLRLKAALREVVLAVLVAERSGETSAQRRVDPRLQAFQALVDEAPSMKLSVAQMARQLGVSMRHLSNLYRSGTGKASQGVIHAAVLGEACRMLGYNRLLFAEIGHSLGFEDPAFFRRFFQQQTGMPPRGVSRHD